MAAPTEKEASVVAKALAMPLAKGRKKLQATSLSNPESDWVKILFQGHTGSGKTLSLARILQTKNASGLPTKIFVASTDIGGNGLRSVREELKSIGRPELLDNIANVDFTTYEDLAAFTTNPDCVEINGRPFWEFDPDILAWDGFSNFQESLAWRYVMDIESIAKDPNEAREAGVTAGIVEWGQLRRVTILQIDQFANLHNPSGKKLHKIFTVLMDDGKEDKYSHEVKKGPLVIGAARAYVGPAFDFVITTEAGVKPGSKVPEYRYRCEVGSSTVAKVRGANIPEAILKAADAKALWEFLTTPAISVKA